MEAGNVIISLGKVVSPTPDKASYEFKVRIANTSGQNRLIANLVNFRSRITIETNLWACLGGSF